jgi:hypothetical protein
VSRTGPIAAEPATDAALRESVASLRAAKDAAETAVDATRKDLSDAQAARAAAESAAEAAHADLEKERQAREDALRAIQELEAKLLSEKSAKDAAGRAATDAKLALEKERMAREAVERAAREGGARAGKSSSSNGKDASFGKDKGAQIETSATPTATAENADPTKSVWTVASEGKHEAAASKPAASVNAKRSRRRVAVKTVIVPPRIKPTYVVDLHDVPWPYSAWYRRR